MTGGFGWELAAAIAFVGTHFLLSHPWRAPIVRRIGERGFLGVYSLVAAATLTWLVFAFRAAPFGIPVWEAGTGLWVFATLLMWLASLLLVGSLIRNPALPDPTARDAAIPDPHGVFTITRHPMMWSFALWAAVHILVLPDAANLILAGAILVLALVGAALQDAKKAHLDPARWPDWEARTSYWPFAAALAGRAPLQAPGLGVVIGGTLLWLAATWAHLPLAGVAAGVWAWLP